MTPDEIDELVDLVAGTTDPDLLDELAETALSIGDPSGAVLARLVEAVRVPKYGDRPSREALHIWATYLVMPLADDPSYWDGAA